MNRWLRDENDGCSPRIKDDGVNCGISFANLPDNYGKNFRCDSVGDSSFPTKSMGNSLTAGNTCRWHFRFEAAWLIEESCESEVKRLWDCTKGSIPDRLVELGVGLDAWFAHIKRDRRLTVNDLRKGLVELADLRHCGNHVSELDSASGQYIQDPHDMARVAMEYFHNMFASQSPTDGDRVLQGNVAVAMLLSGPGTRAESGDKLGAGAGAGAGLLAAMTVLMEAATTIIAHDIFFMPMAQGQMSSELNIPSGFQLDIQFSYSSLAAVVLGS
ncbi:hypothetical protein V6N12_041512 [Hibiscus sabdariffa]|uniref:Uncharacterized protein n=1 Tax=Hibiscus sabdariffa TaxID=183260 RepID=A0ABR2AIJ9_9ROSI